MRSFAPGEVIFFGEHAVVYGRSAVAGAISLGIEAEATPLEGRIEIISHLGRVVGVLESGRVRAIQTHDLLEPLLPLFEAAFMKAGRSVGMRVEIRSSIPEQSGLASSAAVSSALLRLVFSFLGHPVTPAEFVDLVYQSEIRIQKRGSILGSACTAVGGFVEVKKGAWRPLHVARADFPVFVADTRERCATWKTTQAVKELLDRDPNGTEGLFDEMDAIAVEGQKMLETDRLEAVGRLMNENQERLSRLGVSTAKIDAFLKAAAPYVLGGKITGAGGGGCVVCLPKEGAEAELAALAARHDCAALSAKLSGEGARLLDGERACKR
jgi:mevalonate kinase